MQNDIFSEITDIMMKLGLRPKLHGFDYLREVIALCYQKDMEEEKLTVEIYPKVAKKYEVSDMVVERSIRLLIQDSFDDRRLLGLNTLYDCVVYDGTYNFSNSELISIITEILKLNHLKRNLSENEKMIAKNDKIC